ncbi:MAG: helix-turn-helix transcriptional regulator [Cyanobacteria bacterium SBLK]|nr:helix-turn-helix transcriptional regulator [Cyanobacteria bacterium SBLK]
MEASPDPKNIGRNIRELRKAEGLSQTQFAKKVKLTQSAISQFEDGKRVPSTQALQKIATAFNISMDNLMGREVSDEEDSSKDAAIQALVRMLKNPNVKKENILSLNRFVADIYDTNDEDDKGDK